MTMGGLHLTIEVSAIQEQFPLNSRGFHDCREISIFTSEKMDSDGLKIGVLISLHDGGLAWWTEDEVLQERTAVSIFIYMHCYLSTNVYL